MLVSFLIPTFRDYDSYAKKTVDSICNSAFSFDYEILICSKNSVNDTRVRWILEPSENEGSVLPINLAYKASLGEYVALLNDDFSIDGTFSLCLDFLKDRAVQITALYPNKWIEENDLKYIPNHIGEFLPAQMMCFPVGKKSDFQKVLGDNLLDSRFKHHWSDVWLTFFLFKRLDKAIELCKDSIIFMREASSRQVYDFEDRRRYFNFVANYSNNTIYG